MPGAPLADIPVPQQDYDQDQDQQRRQDLASWATTTAQRDDLHDWAAQTAAADQQAQQQAQTQAAAQTAAQQAATRTYDTVTSGRDDLTSWASQVAAREPPADLGAWASQVAARDAPAPTTTDVGGTDWRSYAAQAAQRAGIDPALFQRQIQQESGFDPAARSGAGAVGIAQIVPSAHPTVDPTDPRASLDYAANWMRSLVDRYGGDVRKALAAYNAGPGAVDKYGGVPPFEETQRYVRAIADQPADTSSAAPAMPSASTQAAQTSAGARNRAEAVGQFEQGLPYDEAAAICGPVAALAFIQANGRNPSLAEVRATARQVGWTPEGGMNGLANEKRLLDAFGTPSKLDTAPDFGHIAQDAASGNPVIISTDKHYYYANDYDPSTGKLRVAKTGEARRGGGSWMTPQEISRLDGGINGALFVDNPQSPTPSVGADPMAAGDEGDRPASEFEEPTQRPLSALERVVAGTYEPEPAPDQGIGRQAIGLLGQGFDVVGQGLSKVAAPFRAGIPDPLHPSGESPGQRIARLAQASMAEHPDWNIFQHLGTALDQSQQGYASVKALGPQADPTGGLLSGAANTVLGIGTDPLTTVGGIGGRLAEAGAVGGGVAGAGYGLATGGTPEQVASDIETGSGLASLGLPAGVGAARLAGRVAPRVGAALGDLASLGPASQRLGIAAGGQMPPASVGRSLEAAADAVTDPASGRVLRPAAREVVDAYDRLSAERAPVIRQRAVDTLTGDLGQPALRPLIEQAFDAGKRMLRGAKTITTELSPPQLEEILRTGEAPRSMFGAVRDEDAAARAAYASVNGFPYSERLARLAEETGVPRKGERITLDEARQFNQTVAQADRGAVGSSEYLGGDADAVPRMYALVTEGEMMPNERQGLVYVYWKPGTERVSTLHHHFGLVDSERDYHAGMHPGLRSLIQDQPGGTVALPSGRTIANTPWLVGPSAEDDIRMAALVASAPEAVRQRILSGALRDPEDIAAVLLRGGMGKNQPLKAEAVKAGVALTTGQLKEAGLPEDYRFHLAQGVNANRTESLILDPSLHNIQAIAISGPPASLTRAGTGGVPSSVQAAQHLADAVERATGTRPPVVTTPFVPGMAKAVDPRLSPGRAAIVERYTRAGFPDIGVTAPGLGRLGAPGLPNLAGAAAGGAAGYASSPDTDTTTQRLERIGAGALLGATGVAAARGELRGPVGRVLGATDEAGGLLGPTGRPIRPTAGETAPILDRLGETLKDVTVRAPKEAVTHPEFLQPEAALPAKTVSLVRQGYDRVRNVVASMGEAGQELANRMHAWREAAETDASRYIHAEMPTVKTLGKADFTNMVDVLEGNAKPVSARVAQAASEAKGVLDDIFSRAQNAQVDVADRIDNYFPHVYKDATIRQRLDTARRGELIRRVMDERNLPEDEATAVVHRFIQGGERDRRQGSLEMARLANLPGYEKTKEALYNHVLTATRRIHEVAQFGRDDAIANRLIDRMGAEGYPIGLARDLFQTAVGAHTYPEQLQKLSSIARAYQTITRLGWAVLGNATQPVNTASVSGVVRTLLNAPKAAFSPTEKRFADLTGATLDSVIKEVREGGGWSDRVTGKAMLGFNEVEKFNRRLSALAGRDFARDMAARAAGTATGLNRIGTRSGAVRALEKMGLDAKAIIERGGTLTPAEEIAAARNHVEREQFRTDPQDIPEWASHPLGKMAFQFKAFSYAQSAFVARELLAEAKKGNVAPFIRFAILAPLAQAAATETRNLVSGRDPEEDPGMRAVQYALGPLGLVGDVARTVVGINSKYVPPERRASMLVGSMLGPTAGTLTEAGVAGLSAGDILFHPDETKVSARLTPALRMALRQLPYVGGMAANKITPYKSQQESAPSRSSRPDTSRTDTRRGGRADTRR